MENHSQSRMDSLYGSNLSITLEFQYSIYQTHYLPQSKMLFLLRLTISSSLKNVSICLVRDLLCNLVPCLILIAEA